MQEGFCLLIEKILTDSQLCTQDATQNLKLCCLWFLANPKPPRFKKLSTQNSTAPLIIYGLVQKSQPNVLEPFLDLLLLFPFSFFRALDLA